VIEAIENKEIIEEMISKNSTSQIRFGKNKFVY
jgi:hypothetical protein